MLLFTYELFCLQGKCPVLLTGNGVPIADKKASLTVGPNGPILLQDYVFLDELSHFARERIPERVVHAKGAGTSIRHVLIVSKIVHPDAGNVEQTLAMIFRIL